MFLFRKKSLPKNLDVSSELTVITTTNFVKSCPSTELIEKTIDSFNEKLGIAKYRHIIFYDMSPSPTDKHIEYLENLKKLQTKYQSSIEILTGNNGSMKPGCLAMIPMVKTPFTFFLEHDWEFEQSIDIQKIFNVLKKYSFMNYLRFNRRKNIIHGWDYRLEPEPRVTEISCLKSWCFSNLPYIAKTEALQKWLAIIESDSYFENINPVEGPIQVRIFQDSMKYNYPKAHEMWGTYIYGKMNAPKVVNHLDGRLKFKMSPE
jgi:hypothetical protein